MPQSARWSGLGSGWSTAPDLRGGGQRGNLVGTQCVDCGGGQGAMTEAVDIAEMSVVSMAAA